MSQDETLNMAVEEVEETIIEAEPKPQEELKLGIVTGCDRLRVRELPNIEANVICELIVFSRVIIDEADSTEDFYKVYTEAGVEGFCMKDYITINR